MNNVNDSDNLILIDDIPFEFDRDVAFKKAGIQPGTSDEDDFIELISRVEEVARPKALYRLCYVESIEGDNVNVEGSVFESRVLSRNLDRKGRVFAYVVTCGREVEQLRGDAGDLLQEYRLDVLRELILHDAYAHIKSLLENRYAIPIVSSMSPGDAGLWPIEQQKELFGLLGDTYRLIGVELTDSCLMLPNKSISGMFFPSEVDFHSCKLCRREDCVDRIEPLDQELWDSVHE